MERNLRRTYGLENYVAVAALHSEKTSGEPIKGGDEVFGYQCYKVFFYYSLPNLRFIDNTFPVW